MLATHTRAGILIGAAVMSIFAWWFGARQNQRRALGGKISHAKKIWLGLAVWWWFMLAPLLALDPAVPRVFALGFGLFGLSMMLRGACEMVMLYVSKNWRPPIGIGHDLSCIVLLGVCLALGAADLPAALAQRPGQALFAIYVTTFVSLLAEIYYARAFFLAVEGRTTGADGVWFADMEDPRFRHINRVTMGCNAIFLASLAGSLFVLFRGS